MKRVLAWLEGKKSRPEPRKDPQADGADDTVAPGKTEPEVDPAPGQAADDPDFTVTVPNLELARAKAADADQSAGFNPYDTAELHKK